VFSREFGYTVGFFLIWSMTAAASWLTAILLVRQTQP